MINGFFPVSGSVVNTFVIDLSDLETIEDILPNLHLILLYPDPRPRQRQLSDGVSRLKDEIDEQNRKTMELQHEIKRATENFRSSVTRPTFLSNMNSNNNNIASSRRPTTGGGFRDYSVPYEGTNTTEHVERALEDSQVSGSLDRFVRSGWPIYENRNS